MAGKTSKKGKFSKEEEERVIDFVKSNEILFNVKHTKFRDAEAKNRLWLSLAKELNKDGVYSFVYCLQIREFNLMFVCS